jgi:hypothetical protein
MARIQHLAVLLLAVLVTVAAARPVHNNSFLEASGACGGLSACGHSCHCAGSWVLGAACMPDSASK